MGRNTKFAVGGLLSGIGRGMETIGQRRYAGEKAKADDTRARSMIDLARKNNNEDWLNRRETTRIDQETDRDAAREVTLKDRDALREVTLKDRKTAKSDAVGLLTTANTYKESENKKKVSSYRQNPDGTETPVNIYGEEIGEPRKRQLTAGEFKAQGVAGDGKYDNPLSDDARKLMYDKFATGIFSKILSVSDDAAGMEQFVLKNSLGENIGYDIPLMKAKHPKEAAKLEQVELQLEENLKTMKSPAQAVDKAMKQVEAMTNRQVTAANKEANTALAKAVGMPYEQFDALINLPNSEKSVSEIYKIKSTDESQFDKVVDLLARKGRVDLVEAINVRMQSNPGYAPKNTEEYLAARKNPAFRAAEDTKRGMLSEPAVDPDPYGEQEAMVGY